VGKCSIYSGCSFSRFNLEKEHPLFIEHFVGKFFEKKIKMSNSFIPHTILAKWRHPEVSADDRVLELWMRITDLDVYQQFKDHRCTVSQKAAIHNALRERYGNLTRWATRVEWDCPDSTSDFLIAEEDEVYFLLTKEGLSDEPRETDVEEQWKNAMTGYMECHPEDRHLYYAVLQGIDGRMPPGYRSVFVLPVLPTPPI
jgi:hypothetical protein